MARITQWHPAFCSAMRLELKDNVENLEYQTEYNLNTKPIQIDLLVIRKKKDKRIENEIGQIFRGHNIMEYKSPGDAMNIDTYFKTLAYACLYKAQSDKVDGIKAEDITISLVRREKPVKLLKCLKQSGYQISRPYAGVYYVKKAGIFDTQIVVSQELTEASHLWLKALTRDMEDELARRLVVNIQALADMASKRYADSVLNVAMDENPRLFGKLKEDDNMCEALRKLMQPEIEQALAEGMARSLAEGREKGLEEGREKGLAEGREEGREEGRMQGEAGNLVKNVHSLMNSLKKSAEDVCILLNTPYEEYEKAKKIIQSL